MTDDTIRSILQRLNRKLPQDIIIRPISDRVWWGFVWGSKPEGYTLGGVVQGEGDELFFVKADDGKFAAAILRMRAGDFHWFVLSAYRGKRILVEPLKRVILPFIFHRYKDCPAQKATLHLGRHYADQSAKLAVRVGFRKMQESSTQVVFQINREDVLPYQGFQVEPMEIPQAEALKRKVALNSRSLAMLLDVIRVQGSEQVSFDKAEQASLDLVGAKFILDDLLEDIIWSRKDAQAN